MQEIRERQTHPWVIAGNQHVRAGVSFVDPCADWQNYYACAKAAEGLGFDAIWVPDHPTIATDCWSILAALAVTTSRIRLGTLVASVSYRSPLLLARLAADIDRLSQGRLLLGLGIGDMAEEFKELGLAFPGIKERQENLEKVISAVQEAWQRIRPGPVQQPHIPLLIAGGGARTLQQVAQYADASNFGPMRDTGGVSQLGDVVRKCQTIQENCEEFQRPANSVLRTHITFPLVLGETAEAIAAKQEHIPLPLRRKLQSGTIAVTVPEAREYYASLLRAGIQYFIIGIWPGDVETMRLFHTHVLQDLSIS